MVVTKAEPNARDVTDNVDEDNGAIITTIQGKCYKLCNLEFPCLLCQAGRDKCGLDEPLERFCALPFLH